MKNIIYFLINHATSLYFVLLEIVCLVLIFNFNDYQRSAFLSSSNAVCGAAFTAKNAVTRYFSYGKANRQLAAENAELRMQIDQLREALKTSKQQAWTERVSEAQHYIHRTANVINSTSNRSHNFLTIDAGLKAGIDRDMIVTSGGCVVGLVTAVSEHYATVMPIINTSFHLSVKLYESNFRGQLVWDGVSALHATMTDVPEHAVVKAGDRIVTSGSSSYFPEGLMVGEVSEVEMDKSGGFYHLGVNIAADFNSIYSVEVIESVRRAEQQTLEEGKADE